MLLILEIAFWLCILGVTYTYFIYPILIRFLAKKQSPNHLLFTENEQLPTVAILIAAYNEEKVIAQKLQSILQLNYPKELLHIFIGNDLSSDNTAKIVEKIQSQFSSLQFINMPQRSGKCVVINHLAQLAKQQLPKETIFILTDANVLLQENCVMQLVKHFKNQEIGLVGANIVNTKNDNMVGELESMYVSRENKMKQAEGLFHGALMGAFGACYAIRAELFKTIPTNFLMEDFYITMQVHNQNKQCIFEMNAIAFEDVPGSMMEEFKRKSRIASGNFQNLFFFKHWLLRPFTPVGFAFISHKILRWFTPFFAIAGLILVWKLSNSHLHYELYEYIFWYKFVFWGLFFVDILLVQINIHIKPLRLLTYFYFMNIAILVGFFKFLKGIRSAAWQSTERKI